MLTLVAAAAAAAAAAMVGRGRQRRRLHRAAARPGRTFSRRRTRTGRPEPDVDLALATELLAACLTAGAGMPDALMTAASAAGPAAGDALQRAASALRMGEPVAAVWAAAARDCAPLADVSRACVRTTMTGAAVASELLRVAARHRADRSALRQRAIGRASVWMVLPLGACFLPAFVLVGVVPVLLAAVRHLP